MVPVISTGGDLVELGCDSLNMPVSLYLVVVCPVSSILRRVQGKSLIFSLFSVFFFCCCKGASDSFQAFYMLELKLLKYLFFVWYFKTHSIIIVITTCFLNF